MPFRNNILTVPLKSVFGLENIFIMMDKDLWQRFCGWKLIVEPCWILNSSLDVPGYWIRWESAKKGSILSSGKKLYATMVIFILSQNSLGILNFIILPCCSFYIKCSLRFPVGTIVFQVGILFRHVVDPSGSGT